MAIPCPCCRFRTLTERGAFEICPVCYWQDDGPDRAEPHNLISLLEGQETFAAIGASDLLYIGEVRPPLPSER
jgi:Cysteine-rich CPCC